MEWWGSKCQLWVCKLAKLRFFVHQIFYRAHMNIPKGDNQFHNIPRCVAKFRESQFRDVKKSVDGKDDFKKDHD